MGIDCTFQGISSILDVLEASGGVIAIAAAVDLNGVVPFPGENRCRCRNPKGLLSIKTVARFEKIDSCRCGALKHPLPVVGFAERGAGGRRAWLLRATSAQKFMGKNAACFWDWLRTNCCGMHGVARRQ
eukprot:m.39515 g.39515  ORF g.39515 m.39515 type:complete len:129 (-) comp7971_c0_seq1:1006-1392(-)